MEGVSTCCEHPETPIAVLAAAAAEVCKRVRRETVMAGVLMVKGEDATG